MNSRGQETAEPSGSNGRPGQNSPSVAAKLDFRPATPRQQYSPAAESSRRGQANGFGGGRHAGSLASGAETPPDLRRLSSSDNPQHSGDGPAAQKSYSLRCVCGIRWRSLETSWLSCVPVLGLVCAKMAHQT